MTHIFYVNGEFIAEDEATLPVRDLSILRGYGAFDFLRTYNGTPFRLMRNVQRLRRSCDLIELALPWSDDELYDIITETLERNRQQQPADAEFNVRLVVTGGISPDNITPQGEPSLMVMVQRLHELPDEWYSTGVKVVTVDIQRLIPGAKSINYIPAIIARKRAHEAGGVEALYRTPDDHITEGTTTNVFAFIGETLVTPEANILPGLTRQTVLEIAEPHYAIKERPLTYDELLSAREVFITAANKRIVPVVQVDETVIGAGTPGEDTRHIMQRFDAVTWQADIREEV